MESDVPGIVSPVALLIQCRIQYCYVIRSVQSRCVISNKCNNFIERVCVCVSRIVNVTTTKTVHLTRIEIKNVLGDLAAFCIQRICL